MSVVNSIFAQGERSLLASGHGDELTVLSGDSIGLKFTARIDNQLAFDGQGMYGSDPRMVDVMRFLPPGVPSLKRGDILTDGVTRYTVTKLLNDDSSAITTDFEVQKVK